MFKYCESKYAFSNFSKTIARAKADLRVFHFQDQKTHQHNGNDSNKARTINDEVGNESSSDEDQHAQDNGSGNQETLRRNRGPRPAYSDANMQHSLGYLP